MKYLIETTEVYRCDSEDEAKSLIEQAKKTSVLTKYNCVARVKKAKGEIVDAWYKLTLTKKWDEEKEPCGGTVVNYGKDSAWENDNEGEDE